MHHSDLCEWSDSAFFTSATSSFTVVSTFSLWAQRVCGGGRECGATKAESNQTHTHINTHTHTHIAEVQSMRRLQGQDCGRKRSVDVAVFFFFVHCTVSQHLVKVNARLSRHRVPQYFDTARTGCGDQLAVNWTHPACLVHLIGLYGRPLAGRLGLLDYRIEKQLFISTKSFQD